MGSALFVPFEFAFQAAQLGLQHCSAAAALLLWATDAGITVGILHRLHKLLNWGLQQEEAQCRITVTLLQHYSTALLRVAQNTILLPTLV